MGSNKYIITKIECWPVFKQDPEKGLEAIAGKVATVKSKNRPQLQM